MRHPTAAPLSLCGRRRGATGTRMIRLLLTMPIKRLMPTIAITLRSKCAALKRRGPKHARGIAMAAPGHRSHLPRAEAGKKLQANDRPEAKEPHRTERSG